MQWGMMIPVAAIVAGPVAWMFSTRVRARHGYPVDNERGELIGRLKKRPAVLERIATDPAARIAGEIEALRDTEMAR